MVSLSSDCPGANVAKLSRFQSANRVVSAGSCFENTESDWLWSCSDGEQRQLNSLFTRKDTARFSRAP